MPKPKCLCGDCKVSNCDKKKNLVKRKQGKTNRNTGRYAEKLFQKWCTDRNIKALPTVMSGQHKEIADKVKTKKFMFSGDFHIEGLLKRRLKVEVKKRQEVLIHKYYAVTAFDDIIHLEGFCYIVNGKCLTEIVQGHRNFPIVQLEDKNHALLHSFFNQDNADIVAMIAKGDNGKYLDFVFAISENTFKELFKS